MINACKNENITEKLLVKVNRNLDWTSLNKKFSWCYPRTLLKSCLVNKLRAQHTKAGRLEIPQNWWMKREDGLFIHLQLSEGCNVTMLEMKGQVQRRKLTSLSAYKRCCAPWFHTLSFQGCFGHSCASVHAEWQWDDITTSAGSSWGPSTAQEVGARSCCCLSSHTFSFS